MWLKVLWHVNELKQVSVPVRYQRATTIITETGRDISLNIKRLAFLTIPLNQASCQVEVVDTDRWVKKTKQKPEGASDREPADR